MNLINTTLTLSPLKPSFSGRTTVKIVVHTVLECWSYAHAVGTSIELLFHVVYLISCLKVRFAQQQYCSNKSDRM